MNEIKETKKSYCSIEMVVKETCKEKKTWEENYPSFLVSLQTAKKLKIYNDPDTTWSNKNSKFYNNLVDFLNEQEDNYKDRLEDKWTYEFPSEKDEPGGICVYECKVKKLILRSDQFGFSAPQDLDTMDKKYPYGEYILSSTPEELNKRCENVSNWIYNTRSIGGSFLWPLFESKKSSSIYNMKRGRKSYIQDRVDLTLLEIKEFYQKLYNKKGSKNDFDNVKTALKDLVLLSDVRDAEFIYKWLSHFKTFENYIDFFCLKPFCDDYYNPIDITNKFKGKIPIVKPEKKEETFKYDGNISFKDNSVEARSKHIEDMCNELSNKIVDRSKDIEDIINQKKAEIANDKD